MSPWPWHSIHDILKTITMIIPARTQPGTTTQSKTTCDSSTCQLSSASTTTTTSPASPRSRALRLHVRNVKSVSHCSATSGGLQRVYDIIKRIGENQRRGDVTTLGTLERLREAVNDVGLDELGLVDRKNSKCDNSTRDIEYMHLYEDEHVSMGIFCLPKNSRIPLHNHPGMSVVSRVLYGDLHVSSFDWNTSNNSTTTVHGNVRGDTIAKPVYDGVIHGGVGLDMHATHMLLPNSHGNLHQFTALSDCAVLDVLCPPYSSENGRDCTYYRVEKVLPDGCAELCEFNPHGSNFRIVTVEYTGRPSADFL